MKRDNKVGWEYYIKITKNLKREEILVKNQRWTRRDDASWMWTWGSAGRRLEDKMKDGKKAVMEGDKQET